MDWRESVPGGHYWLKHFALPSPDRIWPPFLLQLFGKRLGLVLVYIFGAGVDAWWRESLWRSRPQVFSNRGPRALMRPGKPHISRWPSFCHETLRNRYVKNEHLNATETSSYRASRSVLRTQSSQNPYWKTQEYRLVTYDALNRLIMNCSDV